MKLAHPSPASDDELLSLLPQIPQRIQFSVRISTDRAGAFGMNADATRLFVCPFSAYRLEALKGDCKGQHSIRVNQQWRVCFRWTESGPADVEIVDYH